MDATAVLKRPPSERPRPPYVQKGMFDVFGTEKPAGSVVSQIYHHTQQLGQARDRGRSRGRGTRRS